jgi:N6-L-threonylcarbamoyladenine synthase
MNHVSNGLILGIESSCDETAAAVVRGGRETLSNVVASQIALHANYGGVVPELAGREHLRNIVPVVEAALAKAGVRLSDIDAIAVTAGPGLAGALLVGVTYAKALAFGLGKPLIAVNHLEGHIHAVLLEIAGASPSAESSPAAMELPLLALVVSGGHTHLYLVERSTTQPSEDWQYRNVGRTVDDAAGEAFDKVAKLLGLGYPGGPWIDALARLGDPHAVPFRLHGIKPKPHQTAPAASTQARHAGLPPTDGAHNFSFSGIKTAVLRYVETNGMREAATARRVTLSAMGDLKPTEAAERLRAMGLLDEQTLGLIASFQRAVVDYLARQTYRVAEHFGARGILVSGGVAANRELRERFTAEAALRHLPIAFPSLALSTDNAAMIAAAAWPLYRAGRFADDTLGATPQLRLG